MKQTLRYGAQTDPGRKRTLNEDTFGALADKGLWFVADGMGGHSSGEVASRIVADHILAGIGAGEGLVEAIEGAHRSVVEAAGRGEGSPQMGSTVVALRSGGDGYEVAWVGDSRAYLWDGALHPLTRDHSLIQEYLDSRNLDADAVDLSQWSNVITQCLGPANAGTPRVDRVSGDWHAGEKILLCSDGLHGEVGEQGIAGLLAAGDGADDQALAETLVQAARDAGGGDNVTVVLVSAPADAAGRRADAGRRSLGTLVLGVAAACLLGLLLLYLNTRQ